MREEGEAWLPEGTGWLVREMARARFWRLDPRAEPRPSPPPPLAAQVLAVARLGAAQGCCEAWLETPMGAYQPRFADKDAG